MKREFFMKAIGGIDDDLVSEAAAEESKPKKKPMPWRTLSGIAAAVVIACGVWTAVQLTNANDASAENMLSPDMAYPEVGFGDDHQYSSKHEIADGFMDYEADTEIALDPSYDTEPYIVKDVCFYIYKDGAYNTLTRSYPDGIPDSVTVMNDYLTAIESSARCLSVKIETVGETDRVIGDIVEHTAGVRTAYVSLEGETSEDVLRGLVSTLRGVAGVDYVRLEDAHGALLPISGDAPEEGFDARSFLN